MLYISLGKGGRRYAMSLGNEEGRYAVHIFR